MNRIILHLSRSLRHHFSLMFATFTVLTGSFAVVAGLFLFQKNTEKLISLWGENLEMVVYLDETASNQQISSIEQDLKNDQRIDNVQLISKQDALKDFQIQMASYAPDFVEDIKLLSFIPQSFLVRLKSSLIENSPLEALKSISSHVETFSGVQNVSYGQDWVSQYSGLVKATRQIGFWIIACIIAACAFVVANSVSSSIQQRKYEIEVLELVGASRFSIRLPFLIEGFFIGLISSVSALAVLYFAFTELRSFLMTNPVTSALSLHLNYFDFMHMLALTLVASGLGVISSALVLRKLNTGWAAAESLGQ